MLLRRFTYEAERKNMKNCKECTHPGRDCIPYLMTVSQSDLLEWCKHRKKEMRMSNEDIADRTNVPKGTVDRVFSPRDADYRFTTMQPIVCVLSGCNAEELDCEAAYLTPSEALLEQVKAKDEIIRHLEEETKRQDEHIKHLEAAAKADIERAKKEEAESIAYMKKKEKSHIRLIYTLAIALSITVLTILTALIVDRLNPDIGFFWLRSWFGGKTGLRG